MALSKGGYQGYGAVREYRDYPNYGEYRDENGVSFEEIFSQITRNITGINNGANMIEKVAKVTGTNRDHRHACEKIHHISQDISKTVNATTRLLKQLKKRRLDRSQKLQIEKVSHDFQESHQRFQTLEKKATEKVRNSSGREIQKPKKSAYQDFEDIKSLIADDNKRRKLITKEQIIGIRQQFIDQKQGDLSDVKEIFRDLGVLMIYGQDEQKDTIEVNEEKAYTVEDQETVQLKKASTQKKKTRKKLCYLCCRST